MLNSKFFLRMTILICVFFTASCTYHENEIINEDHDLSVINKSEAEIKQYIDSRDWIEHKLITIRTDDCWSCISEDVLGGAEGCAIGSWLGGPIGCAIGGSLVASYRSIREADRTGFSKSKGPRRTKNKRQIMPLLTNHNNFSHIGVAHNLILDKFINGKIDISNLNNFYLSASEVICKIPQLNSKIIDDINFKFGILYTLNKIHQGYSIQFDAGTSNFIKKLSKIDSKIDSKELLNEILKIKNNSFTTSPDAIEMQNREQMEAIGYYTHNFWNK